MNDTYTHTITVTFEEPVYWCGDVLCEGFELFALKFMETYPPVVPAFIIALIIALIIATPFFFYMRYKLNKKYASKNSLKNLEGKK